jgi:hypothetical protein
MCCNVVIVYKPRRGYLGKLSTRSENIVNLGPNVQSSDYHDERYGSGESLFFKRGP